jgi:N-formylglutamate amidohydrolase
VTRNNPYAGGFTTQHYGDPGNGVHAIQIEINRAIYMDEVTLQRRKGFSRLKTDVNALIRHITGFAAESYHHLQYQRLSAE